MKIYLVLILVGHDDAYDLWQDTYIDSVWSTIDKAQERLTHLKDDWLEKNCKAKKDRYPEECEGCPMCYFDYRTCFHEDIDDSYPNHITIYQEDYYYRQFLIQECPVDVVGDEGK